MGADTAGFDLCVMLARRGHEGVEQPVYYAGKQVGSWVTHHPNGQRASAGRYNAAGRRSGTWTGS